MCQSARYPTRDDGHRRAARATCVAAVNAAVAAGRRAGSGCRGRDRTSARARRFWLALRAAQAGALLFAVLVGVLAAAGDQPTEYLFYLYALLPLAVAFVAEQLRVASAQTILDQRDLDGRAGGRRAARGEQLELVAQIVRREVGVMALSALVVVFLALRAAGTAHGL